MEPPCFLYSQLSSKVEESPCISWANKRSRLAPGCSKQTVIKEVVRVILKIQELKELIPTRCSPHVVFEITITEYFIKSLL